MRLWSQSSNAISASCSEVDAFSSGWPRSLASYHGARRALAPTLQAVAAQLQSLWDAQPALLSCHPAGRMGALAEHAARLLGGRLSLPGYRDTTPPGAVN